MSGPAADNLEPAMTLARKTQAKYGAKIPAARDTGAKQGAAEKQGTPADAAPKTARKRNDKKP